MQYYGGREVSEEDLERALLAGMSPHKRRRFQKKRGYTFKKLTRNTIKDEQEGNLHFSNPDNASDRDKCSKEDGNHDGVEEIDINSLYLCIGVKNDTEVLAVDDKETTLDENGSSNGRLISNSSRTNSTKNSSKLCLLGHGPHGKQVVDYIIKNYGEEGIRQFCQKWRQVLVEAIHPRFLPTGWDVMHRS